MLNELKNRGVKDILVICADGLSGMKEAVAAAYPQTELQRCIVHQVRNTLKYAGEKNKKDYPNAMKSWHTNWDVISPIFKFSAQVRKVIYTTNAIESLNSGYRRLNKQRSVFPSDTALLKALYLATTEISKKWTMPLRDWGKVLGELDKQQYSIYTEKGNRATDQPLSAQSHFSAVDFFYRDFFAKPIITPFRFSRHYIFRYCGLPFVVAST